jgi:hypothetical protein
MQVAVQGRRRRDSEGPAVFAALDGRILPVERPPLAQSDTAFAAGPIPGPELVVYRPRGDVGAKTRALQVQTVHLSCRITRAGRSPGRGDTVNFC